jgi:hypothetical protein
VDGETHSAVPDVGHLRPGFNNSTIRQSYPTERVLCIPFLSPAIFGIARLEYESATKDEGSLKVGEGALPFAVLDEELRHVTGHDRDIK